MPEAILKFQLPEEAAEHKAACNAGTYSVIIWSFLNEFRNKMKHDVPLEPYRCTEHGESLTEAQKDDPEYGAPAKSEEGHEYLHPKHREALAWARNVLSELIEEYDATELYDG